MARAARDTGSGPLVNDPPGLSFSRGKTGTGRDIDRSPIGPTISLGYFDKRAFSCRDLARRRNSDDGLGYALYNSKQNLFSPAAGRRERRYVWRR